jgi:hypothetical protein
MTNLQIGTLVKGRKTKVIFKAIYLNQVVMEPYPEGEHFYIALYIDEDENDHDKNKTGLNSTQYDLRLNNIEAKSLLELEEENVLRRELPLTEKWSRYYHVEFNDNNATNLNLTFSHKELVTILLPYAKDELEK